MLINCLFLITLSKKHKLAKFIKKHKLANLQACKKHDANKAKGNIEIIQKMMKTDIRKRPNLGLGIFFKKNNLSQLFQNILTTLIAKIKEIS